MSNCATIRWKSYQVVSHSPHYSLLLTQVTNHYKKRETEVNTTKEGVLGADAGY